MHCALHNSVTRVNAPDGGRFSGLSGANIIMGKASKQKQPGTVATEPEAPVPTATESDSASKFLERTGNLIPAWLRLPLCLAIVLTIGICMYFVGRGEPPYPFWDENYHLTSAQRYIDRQAQLEPHPPLGLLLIAAGEVLSGENQGIDKSVMVHVKYIDGDKMPANFSFSGMRLMPGLFGAFGALLFFMLVLEITENKLSALLFSSLYLFENAWIVHFRAVHLDSFQMFFCLAAIWVFLRQWKRSTPVPWLQYAWIGVLCGAAILVKVNAVVLLVMYPILYFKDQGTWQCRGVLAHIEHFCLKAGVSVAGLVVIAYAVFTVHGIVGNHPGNPADPATQNDLQFMSQPYKDYLNGTGSLSPLTVFAIARDYYAYMDNDHKGVPKLEVCKPGENGSAPRVWPLMEKTINYRWDSADGFTKYVQLVGNGFGWYLGLAALIFSFLAIANRRLFRIWVGDKETYALIEVFAALYVVFMVLHMYLGAQRVMYLYHYFIGLLYSYILIVLNWRYFCRMHNLSLSRRTLVAGIIALCLLVSGLFYLPLSNHWKLNKSQCEQRNLLSTIVECQG